MKLKKGQKILLKNDRHLVVNDLLGVGGQGEVYKVEVDGRDYALKVYINEESSDFKYNLRNNIERKSPAATFLWPLEYVEIDDDTFGYLMHIRPSNYESFVSFLNGKVKFKDINTLITWCIELCSSFKKLHEKGFSYQDLNDGSFFLDPSDGSLLICDNDNVTADKKNLGVLGKMKYMAPEIVRGDINPITGDPQMPDTHSDRFSLAIILFMALCLGNPFEGARLKDYDIIDENAEMELYGTNPVFVYHKTDKSNRPIRGYHASLLRRWAYLPIYVKEAFHRTFVDGLIDRENQRTTELEWIRCLCKYRDEIISCSCGYQYPYGLEEKSLLSKCPSCNSKSRDLCRLKIGKHTILLEPNKYIYKHHLDKYSDEYNFMMAKVIASKNDPSRWGLKLRLDSDVVVIDQTGNSKTIDKDGVIPLIKNLKICFKDIDAIIE